MPPESERWVDDLYAFNIHFASGQMNTRQQWLDGGKRGRRERRRRKRRRTGLARKTFSRSPRPPVSGSRISRLHIQSNSFAKLGLSGNCLTRSGMRFLSSGVPSPPQAQAILSPDLFVVDFITHFPSSRPFSSLKTLTLPSPCHLRPSTPPIQSQSSRRWCSSGPQIPVRTTHPTLFGKRARSPPLGFVSMVCAARDARFPKGCPSLA